MTERAEPAVDQATEAPTDAPSPVPNKRYRELEHTADTGIELELGSPEQIFEVACLALFDVIGHPTRLGAAMRTELVAEGADLADTLVRALTEMLALFELRSVFVTEVRCHELTQHRDEGYLVRLEVSGAHFDRHTEHEMTEVKAITYHQLAFDETAEGYFARVIFDL